jgi:hypothetical protein
MLARFEAAKTRVLVNCELLVEGWDMPSARCAVLARPTLSETLYMQQCGRVMRPGSVRPIILDHAGNARWFGLPHHYVPPPLHRTGDAHAPAKIAARICPKCGGVSPAGSKECIECHRALPKKDRLRPEEDRRTLVEIILEAMREAKTTGLTVNAVRGRLNNGWSLHEAVTVKKRVYLWDSWSAVAKKHGVTVNLFNTRIRHKWPVKRAATTRPVSMKKSIVVNGTTYPTMGQAAKALGIAHVTLTKRLQRGVALDKAIRGRAVTIGGVTFPSVKEAAEKLGTSARSVLSREAKEAGLCVSCRKRPSKGKRRCSRCERAEAEARRLRERGTR